MDNQALTTKAPQYQNFYRSIFVKKEVVLQMCLSKQVYDGSKMFGERSRLKLKDWLVQKSATPVILLA
jgi:hypothetical protein